MKLYQVRKGQFVYYDNELHRVYSVKPMYKKSVHLIRLRDLSQQLSKASEIDRYKPMDNDSFVFNKKAYTLRKDKKAEEGNYILITNPNPDYLDHYSLNEIEVVASVENKGVVTTKSNGIKHSEYLLMEPGRAENSHAIDHQNYDHIEEPSNGDESQYDTNALLPSIGDVYKKVHSEETLIAMITALQGNTVYLGNGMNVSQQELMDTQTWEYVTNVSDDE